MKPGRPEEGVDLEEPVARVIINCEEEGESGEAVEKSEGAHDDGAAEYEGAPPADGTTRLRSASEYRQRQRSAPLRAS